MKDFRAIREEVLFGLGWDPETFNELIASPHCRYNHGDPKLMDCFEARCDHTDHFGCRCVECSEENAPICYHGSNAYYYESPQECDSASEETASVRSMEEEDF